LPPDPKPDVTGFLDLISTEFIAPNVGPLLRFLFPKPLELKVHPRLIISKGSTYETSRKDHGF